MRISKDLFKNKSSLYTISENKLIRIVKVCFSHKQAVNYAKKNKKAILVSTQNGIAYFSTLQEMNIGKAG